MSYDCSHLLKSALPAAVSSAFPAATGDEELKVKVKLMDNFICSAVLSFVYSMKKHILDKKKYILYWHSRTFPLSSYHNKLNKKKCCSKRIIVKELILMFNIRTLTPKALEEKWK